MNNLQFFTARSPAHPMGKVADLVSSPALGVDGGCSHYLDSEVFLFLTTKVAFTKQYSFSMNIEPMKMKIRMAKRQTARDSNEKSEINTNDA